jgi:hypothetical protein
MDKIFNNREIATVIWVFVLFFLLLIKKDIRASFLNFIKALFQRKILIILFLITLYFTAITTILYYIKFWNITLLKDSIEWLLFTGILICFNAITANKDEKFFRTIIKENINLIIILEFIINTYTFPLLVELLLIPLLTIIILSGEVAKTNPKHKPVEKLMNNLQIILGMIILFSVIYKTIADFANFWNISTLKSFLLPPILTILFLPFTYLFVLYSRYELLFLRLNIGEKKSEELKNYAKKKVLKCCFLSLNKVNKALNSSYPYDLINIKSKEDVDEFVRVYGEKL